MNIFKRIRYMLKPAPYCCDICGEPLGYPKYGMDGFLLEALDYLEHKVVVHGYVWNEAADRILEDCLEDCL